MPADEQRTPLITSVVGAHPPGGAGLHSHARSPSGGIGGDGLAVVGAAPARLAPLVAPPVARSTSGCGETTAASTHRAPTRWATRTRGADTDLGAGRRGDLGGPRHARPLPAVPAAPAGRRSAASAASSHRDSADEAQHHRVSEPSVSLPRLGRSDASGVARWRVARGLRPAGAGDHGPVYRGIPSVEADHSERPAGSVRRPAVRGDDREPGAGDGPSLG
jgi:hypothetical protein